MSTPTDDRVVAEVVGTEPEAELLCSLLRSAPFTVATRLTNPGAGASDGMPHGGPQEVLLPARDLPAAPDVLASRNASFAGGERPGRVPPGSVPGTGVEDDALTETSPEVAVKAERQLTEPGEPRMLPGRVRTGE